MATSGTTTFNLAIDEIVEEAYERCGIRTNSGYDLASGRRSLNLLLQDWNNRGINLWKIKLIAQLLIAGTSKYSAEAGTSDIMEAYVSNNATLINNTTSSSDVSLTKIDRSAYAALAGKGTRSQPSQYFIDRQGVDPITPQIYLYPSPDASTYTYLKYYAIKRVEDAGAYTDDPDAPNRFLPSLCAGLAFQLAMKRAPDRIQALKLLYEDSMQRALTEDGTRTSTYISPQAYYPTVS
jgi:hypothetical protein